MDTDEPDCDVCGRDMNGIDSVREQCEQCLRTGCDHCVSKYGQEYDDGSYEEWKLCDDCYFGDCRDQR